MCLLDQSTLLQQWRYTSNSRTAACVWRDIEKIPRPLRIANICKITERKAAQLWNNNGPIWQYTVPLTILHPWRGRKGTLEEDREGDLLWSDSALSKQFRLTGIIHAKDLSYAAYVYRLWCSICHNGEGSLYSPTHQVLTQLYARLLLVHKTGLGGRLPSNLHHYSWQAQDGLHH